jgi:hypothetical protein
MMIVYLIKVKPFEDPFFNKLEIFNEVCVLLSIYHLFTFTDFVGNVVMQYNIGWSMVGLTCFNIVTNILIVVICTISELIKKIRKMKCCNRKNQDAVVAIKPEIRIEEKSFYEKMN